MAIFEETPKVDFEVKDDDGNVIYRDSITYASMAELRNDNTLERQAKFQARYDQWLIVSSTPTESPIVDEVQ